MMIISKPLAALVSTITLSTYCTLSATFNYCQCCCIWEHETFLQGQLDVSLFLEGSALDVPDKCTES